MAQETYIFIPLNSLFLDMFVKLWCSMLSFVLVFSSTGAFGSLSLVAQAALKPCPSALITEGLAVRPAFLHVMPKSLLHARQEDYVMAVSIGGGHFNVAIVSKEKIVVQHDVSLVGKLLSEWNDFEILFKESILFLSKTHAVLMADIVSVGVAHPGIPEEGIMKVIFNLPFKNINLRQKFHQLLSWFLSKPYLAVYADNDIKAEALAERKYVAGSFIYLGAGTGINAADIDDDGIITAVELGPTMGLDGKMVEKQFQSKKFTGDARKLVDTFVDTLAILVHQTGRKQIVVGGGVSHTPGFIKALQEQLSERGFKQIHVLAAVEVEHDRGLLGAALLTKQAPSRPTLIQQRLATLDRIYHSLLIHDHDVADSFLALDFASPINALAGQLTVFEKLVSNDKSSKEIRKRVGLLRWRFLQIIRQLDSMVYRQENVLKERASALGLSRKSNAQAVLAIGSRFALLEATFPSMPYATMVEMSSGNDSLAAAAWRQALEHIGLAPNAFDILVAHDLPRLPQTSPSLAMNAETIRLFSPPSPHWWRLEILDPSDDEVILDIKGPGSRGKRPTLMHLHMQKKNKEAWIWNDRQWNRAVIRDLTGMDITEDDWLKTVVEELQKRGFDHVFMPYQKSASFFELIKDLFPGSEIRNGSTYLRLAA